jgi:signal transduction histidine kinase/ActR/RegA family two-component response regulator
LAEQAYDDLTQIAAQICGTPISLVSLVDQDRQWFKSKHGLDATETPRDLAFCAHAILEDKTFYIPDAEKDERFHDNPLVTGAPFVKFYAGFPLSVEGGQKIGTLCVIDHKPRTLTDQQLQALECLGRQVQDQLKLRKKLKELRMETQKAIQAEKSKSLFFANMSHEIRTPLNGILGMTEILAQRMKQEENIKDLNIIQSSGKTLLSIINDILDLSKMDAGKMHLDLVDFSLRQLIEEELTLGQSLARADVKLSYEVDPSLPEWVRSDRVKIKQVLSNYLSNALKFTERGEIRVKLSGTLIQGSRYRINLVVVDSGVGIESSKLGELFTDYTQINQSPNLDCKGTGLGLSICHKIAQLLNGSVFASSQLGQGSTFGISFECNVGQKPEKEKESVEDFKPSDLYSDLKVLLVEDNEINRVVANGFLNKMGIYPDLAFDGLEALEKLERESYDLIFMDCHMPKLDGLATTKKIIERYGQDRPWIIALTASSFQEDIDQCYASGMDDFLSKPLSLKLISEKLSQFIEKNKKAS